MEKIRPTTALAISFVATAVMLIGGLAVTVSHQVAFADPQPTNPKKVLICHNRDPDVPGTGQSIVVGAPAVAAHVRNHGDIIGACPLVPP